jgi:hypothetical protein
LFHVRLETISSGFPALVFPAAHRPDNTWSEPLPKHPRCSQHHDLQPAPRLATGNALTEPPLKQPARPASPTGPRARAWPGAPCSARLARRAVPPQPTHRHPRSWRNELHGHHSQSSASTAVR